MDLRKLMDEPERDLNAWKKEINGTFLRRLYNSIANKEKGWQWGVANIVLAMLCIVALILGICLLGSMYLPLALLVSFLSTFALTAMVLAMVEDSINNAKENIRNLKEEKYSRPDNG